MFLVQLIGFYQLSKTQVIYQQNFNAERKFWSENL